MTFEKEWEARMERLATWLLKLANAEEHLALEYRRCRAMVLESPADWRPSRAEAEMLMLAQGATPSEISKVLGS